MRGIYMHSGTTIARGRRSTSASKYWKSSCLRLTRLSLSESLVLFFVLRAYGAKRNFPAAEYLEWCGLRQKDMHSNLYGT